MIERSFVVNSAVGSTTECTFQTDDATMLALTNTGISYQNSFNTITTTGEVPTVNVSTTQTDPFEGKRFITYDLAFTGINTYDPRIDSTGFMLVCTDSTGKSFQPTYQSCCPSGVGIGYCPTMFPLVAVETNVTCTAGGDLRFSTAETSSPDPPIQSLSQRHPT